MKFGILLGQEHHANDPAQIRYSECLTEFYTARSYNFDSAWIGQHFVGEEYFHFQPIPILSRLAGEAGNMTLGTSVLLLPLLHPVEVVEHATMLDIMTGGKFVLGVGIGYRDAEFSSFGVSLKSRATRFEEALTIIKRLWIGERLNFEGKHFRIRNAKLSLMPVQTPHPPIWIAADNDKAVKRAAIMGDSWLANPHVRNSTLERHVKLYQETLSSIGKPFPTELPLIKFTHLAESTEKAFDEAGKVLENKFKVYVKWGQDKAVPEGDRFDVPLQELRERFIIGDADDCIEYINGIKKVGFNHVIFWTRVPGSSVKLAVKTIRMLGEKVLPYFREE